MATQIENLFGEKIVFLVFCLHLLQSFCIFCVFNIHCIFSVFKNYGLPDCTKQSILYENVCATCVPSAGSKKEMKEEDLNTARPAVFVGETSRSLAERSREHWASYKGRKEDNHILKHHQIAHNNSTPNFIMRMVGAYKTALGRREEGGSKWNPKLKNIIQPLPHSKAPGGK